MGELMKRLGLVLVTLAMFSFSCARTTETGDRIAVFTKNQTNPFFQTVRLGANSAAKQMNATVTHYVPTQPDSIPEQMSQIEDATTKKPNAYPGAIVGKVNVTEAVAPVLVNNAPLSFGRIV